MNGEDLLILYTSWKFCFPNFPAKNDEFQWIKGLQLFCSVILIVTAACKTQMCEQLGRMPKYSVIKLTSVVFFLCFNKLFAVCLDMVFLWNGWPHLEWDPCGNWNYAEWSSTRRIGRHSQMTFVTFSFSELWTSIFQDLPAY